MFTFAVNEPWTWSKKFFEKREPFVRSSRGHVVCHFTLFPTNRNQHKHHLGSFFLLSKHYDSTFEVKKQKFTLKTCYHEFVVASNCGRFRKNYVMFVHSANIKKNIKNCMWSFAYYFNFFYYFLQYLTKST